MKPTLASRIRAARKLTGRSVHRAALAVGVTDRTWYRWEAGEREPDKHDLIWIARILRTTTDYLLGIEQRERAA